jgi:hypothetical protein
MNENKTVEPTPEQLLQVLEIQLQAQRAKRQHAAGNRTALRAGGILLILGGAVAALLILQYAMSELSVRQQSARPATEEQVGN